ncbi:hypothetical protein K488DRAFT_48105, partial [Vararia minispora EC-137]
EIAREHPSLTGREGTDNIHSLETKTIDILLAVLSTHLPALLDKQASMRPVKLLVIDAIADLFREDSRTTTAQLVERSCLLGDLALQLHALASVRGLAIVVLNHVAEVFEPQTQGTPHELIYAEQARIFSSGDSLAAETRKKAALGLVWANEVNARVMLTRTGRRRALGVRTGVKRRRVVSGAAERSRAPHEQNDVLIRRLSVIFSTVSSPTSSDFIVTAQGVEVLPEDVFSYPDSSKVSTGVVVEGSTATSLADLSESQLHDVAPLDVAYAQSSSAPPLEDVTMNEPPVEDEEDEDIYWQGTEDIWNAVSEEMAS